MWVEGGTYRGFRARHRFGHWCLAAVVGASILPLPATAQDGRMERQASLDAILTRLAPSNVRADRQNCASGAMPEATALARKQYGLRNLPNPIDQCVTLLTRLGRDGALELLGGASGQTTPALALDAGFVRGYREAGSASALPTMAALKPIGEQCLAQQRDAKLCYSVGFAFGKRAAAGERISAD